MMQEQKKEITWAQRWLHINAKHEREQVIKDPLCAEFHRGEAEMFDKVFHLLVKLKDIL